MKTAVIILGHGSRSGNADTQIRQVAAEVKKSYGAEIVEHAFLQYMRPGPEDVVEECVRRGAQKIIIVPFFLQAGTHVIKDIPSIVEKAKKKYPDVELTVTAFVGSHPLMASIVLSLLGESER